MIKKNAVLTLPRNGCPRAIRVGRTVVVAAVYIDRGWYIMVYRYIFSRHTTWRGANITHAPREKEGAENPVLGRRVAGGAADVTGGCRRVGKAIATNKPSPPPIDAPIFPLDNVYTLVERVLCTYIYTAIYIHTVKSTDPTGRRRWYPSSPRSTPVGPRTAPRQRTFAPCLENGRRLAIVP